MKLLLLFALICPAALTVFGAEPQPRVKGDAIYFYCTSRTDPDEGVERSENPANDNNPLYVHRPILFRMVSKAKDIFIHFAFYNYNPTELSKTRPVLPVKDQMEIVTGPEPCCGLSIRSTRSRWKTNWHPSKRKKNHGPG